MKKIISLLITTILVTSTVAAAPIIEKTKTETLVSGVEYKNIKGLYPSGWQDIHIVTADLTKKHLNLEILKNKNGQSYMEKTTTSAKENDTVVAVNADFFAAKKGEAGRGSAIGVEIRDGKLYSSASVQESMNTLYKAFDETGFNIDAFTFDITLTAKNGLTDKIKLINKYDDLTGIVMYTSDWAEYSVGSIGGIIEISVDKDGKVTAEIEYETVVIVTTVHKLYNTEGKEVSPGEIEAGAQKLIEYYYSQTWNGELPDTYVGLEGLFEILASTTDTDTSSTDTDSKN